MSEVVKLYQQEGWPALQKHPAKLLDISQAMLARSTRLSIYGSLMTMLIAARFGRVFLAMSNSWLLRKN